MGEHEVTHCGVTKVASCRPPTPRPHSEHWVLDTAILKLELIELREMNVVLRSWGLQVGNIVEIYLYYQIDRE